MKDVFVVFSISISEQWSGGFSGIVLVSTKMAVVVGGGSVVLMGVCQREKFLFQEKVRFK